jgi:hypothetical protein
MNAAMNLKKLTLSFTAYACGGQSTGLGRKSQVKLASTTQEVSSRLTQQ